MNYANGYLSMSFTHCAEVDLLAETSSMLRSAVFFRDIQKATEETRFLEKHGKAMNGKSVNSGVDLSGLSTTDRHSKKHALLCSPSFIKLFSSLSRIKSRQSLQRLFTVTLLEKCK